MCIRDRCPALISVSGGFAGSLRSPLASPTNPSVLTLGCSALQPCRRRPTTTLASASALTL
eukprot:104026-Alexandrium_andersonii.AAC.1